MPTLFPALKTATKPNSENQPPYAVVSALRKPQHMVVFLSLEIVFAPQGMKNPRFQRILIVYFVLLDAARQQLILLSGGIGYMVCPSL